MHLSQAEMKRQIEQLTEIASAPETLQALKKMSDAPEDQRSRLAEELVTPKALAAKGVTMPEDIRMSLRVFEEPTNKSLGAYTYDTATGEQSAETPGFAPESTTVCVSAGVYICVSVGRSTGDDKEQK